MSYCLNPSCQKPQNPDVTKFCQNCGSKLLLKERYRAIKLIGQGGFGRTFLSVKDGKQMFGHGKGNGSYSRSFSKEEYE